MTAPLRGGRQPVEPPPSSFRFPPPQEADDRDGLGLVTVGGDLSPGTLLLAYRSGLFPMNLPDGRRGWWSPPERGVFLPGALKVSRSLRKATARFDVRVDTAFEAVVRACAAQPRPHPWIDDDIVGAYGELHRLGWAHSVESWRDGELAGGLYGLAIGGLFAGESMFHRVADASKVALVALVDRLDDHPETLIDCQWLNAHLASLGAVAIGRDEYLERHGRALARPLPARLLDVDAPAGAGGPGPGHQAAEGTSNDSDVASSAGMGRAK
jgi:leucyl/phenylalanyl-tRNA--protein transferase